MKSKLEKILAQLKEADVHLENFGMITVGLSRRTLLKAIADLEEMIDELSSD